MDSAPKIDLSKLSGQGIRVAVVDSGIDVDHPKIKSVAGGVALTIDANGQMIQNPDHSDCAGHGTACAGIILKKAPETRLYSIRIFDETLSANGQSLIAAIQWAIDQEMDIINLSLGTTDVAHKEAIAEVCQKSTDKGIILISADHNSGLPSYPSHLPNVIGVTGDKIYERYGYYYRPGDIIECVARGDEQRVCWKDGREIMIAGTSYAAPHITGIIALIREAHPRASLQEVREILKANAIPETSSVDHIDTSSSPSITFPQTQDHSSYDWIQKAALYPYNKEMHALIHFRDLLPYDITAVADPVGKGFVGKDPGDVIGTKSVGFKIVSNLQKALPHANTLILGYVDQLGRITKRDLLREAIQTALDHNVHVFSFLPVPPTQYSDLYQQARKKNLKIIYPTITTNEVQQALRQEQQLPPVDVPVLGVFGTSSQQGKFTVQLALRRKLLQMGYKVGQIGTEHHAELFGMDFGFPMGYASPLELPLQIYVPYLDHKMRKICQKKRPEIMLVGSQSGTIPYDIAEHSTHSLPSIAFMLGTKPDACILVVNSIDANEYIQDNIDAIRALGKVPTILLAMSDKEKHIRSAYGRTMINPRQMSRDQIEDKLQYLEKTFNLPAVEIVSEQGQQKMLDTVIRFFANSTTDAQTQTA